MKRLISILCLLVAGLGIAPQAPAMQVERFTVTATTDGSGDATVYSPVLTGRILAVVYVKTDFSNGVDFTITAEATGETIWTQSDVNATARVYPRAAVHDTAGVAATLDGTRAMRDPVALAQDRVKIVVGSGGAAHTGTFIIIVG
jgi:hypothetical protein